MGRHSSKDQGPFLRSFLGWVSVWVIVAVATGIAVWVIVNTIGHPELKTALGHEDTTKSHHAKPTPTPEETVAVVETPIETPVPTPTPTPRAPKTPHNQPLQTEGVTVQVLNGTLQDDAGRLMADRLSGLGYSIVAVEESVKTYPDTTVFWSSPASRDAAEALAERFGWIAEPKPANLSPAVSMHVVVGADESGR